MHPLVKKLAGQTAIYGLPNILGRLLNYLLVPLHTAIFRPSDYGIVSELYAYVSILNIIFTYGMETAYFRFASAEENKKRVYDTALISLFFSTILLTGSILFFSHPIASALKYEQHPEYISWFAMILGLDALCAIPFGRLRMENRPKVYAFFKMLNICINIGLNLFFLVLCPYVMMKGYFPSLKPLIEHLYNPSIGLGYIFISNLAASLVTLLGLTPFIIRKKYELDYYLWKKMLKYASPLIIIGVAGMINETFDRDMLKFFLPLSLEEKLSQIGIYSACYKLSLLMTLFVQAYKMAAEPFFFNEARRHDAKIIYAKTMNYFVITCCVIFVGIMLFLDVVKYFINERYFSGLAVVPVLLMANLSLGVYYNLTVWFKLTDKTRIGAYIPVGGAIITLLLNFFFIPLYGYMASAWATFACYTFMMVASYLMGQKYYHVPYDVRKFLIYVSAALVFYFFSNSISQHLLSIHYLLYAGVNLLLLLAFLFFIYLIEKNIKNPEWDKIVSP